MENLPGDIAIGHQQRVSRAAPRAAVTAAPAVGREANSPDKNVMDPSVIFGTA
jgi:hypothetical protein